MKPIDPSPTPWDHSTWGFYCDACDKFFDLVMDGEVHLDTGDTCTHWHKACGTQSRYIGYDHTVEGKVESEYCRGCAYGSHCLGADPDCACCIEK